jgi:hypothetical protein
MMPSTLSGVASGSDVIRASIIIISSVSVNEFNEFKTYVKVSAHNSGCAAEISLLCHFPLCCGTAFWLHPLSGW